MSPHFTYLNQTSPPSLYSSNSLSCIYSIPSKNTTLNPSSLAVTTQRSHVTWNLKHYLVHLNFLPKALGTGVIYFSCSAQKKKAKQRILIILEIMYVPANTAEKPRASLLVSVLLKCVARKKSQHTVCQIERIKIAWVAKFAEGTLKGELQNTTGFWNSDKYPLASSHSPKNNSIQNRWQTEGTSVRIWSACGWWTRWGSPVGFPEHFTFS